MRKAQTKWITIICYMLIPVAVALLYIPTRETMIAQTAWINVIKSNFTLNFILLFFVWGIAVDKFTKKISRKKSWLIWGIGLVALVLFFRYVGGFKTLWG